MALTPQPYHAVCCSCRAAQRTINTDLQTGSTHKRQADSDVLPYRGGRRGALLAQGGQNRLDT